MRKMRFSIRIHKDPVDRLFLSGLMTRTDGFRVPPTHRSHRLVHNRPLHLIGHVPTRMGISSSEFAIPWRPFPGPHMATASPLASRPDHTSASPWNLLFATFIEKHCYVVTLCEHVCPLDQTQMWSLAKEDVDQTQRTKKNRCINANPSKVFEGKKNNYVLL